MYFCHQCQNQFTTPLQITEKHGFSSPPYETVCVCPYCKSENYEKEKARFCRCCGAKLKNTQTNYCSPSCKKTGEKLLDKEQGYFNRLKSSPLFAIVRELESFNKINCTRFSYGQYCAFINAQAKNKKRRRKNG